ncbi:ECF transporter S component [Angustibacter luteus]|uniref:ECF transporter S component n=1 Tax=Angustibacter luteus TaxID=658456 RepID=A0ABW1JBB2_9ACTN
MSVAPARSAALIAVRWRSSVVLVATMLVGFAAFAWPFVVRPGTGLAHGGDAPWLFVVLLALMAALVVSELASGGLDAKTVSVLGVLAALGGALRVLGAGTAGLEPMFFLLVVSGRVLGRGAGFVLGALSVLVGAFLTGGVGPWAPFQMVAAGMVGFFAGSLPRATGRHERWLLAAYGFVAGLAYGVVMNLWFWPFLASAVGDATTFVPGDPVGANLGRYAAFYLATSLGWDLPRGLLTAALVLGAGRPVLASLRRGARRAAFATAGTFEPPSSLSSAQARMDE